MLPQLRQMKQRLQTLQNASDPQALLMQMAQSNPLINQAIQIGNQYGGDYNKAVAELSKQNGIDIKEIMRMI